MKEIVGKRKEHSLETSDRKLAERRFKDWAANLNKVDTEAEKTTLAQLVDKFKKTREGLAFKTRKTEQWILGTLEEDWAYGWGIQVSRIRALHARRMAGKAGVKAEKQFIRPRHFASETTFRFGGQRPDHR
jgi:hypothetical protein